ncbi:MAG: stage II sporulation protein P [Lachnospiraceae bacterium]|nr:stage II sporulation protein P [Lachnospiraceae bacterium]
MRRSWVRRNKESNLFVLALLCVVTVLAFGMKEQVVCLVYPGISYIADGYDKEENRWIKHLMAFSNGYYGYVTMSEAPELYVENMTGLQSLLKEDEWDSETGQIPPIDESGLHNEGLAQDETMNEVFLSDDIQEGILAENNLQKPFIKAEMPALVLDYERLLDDEYLRKKFYTVDNSTDISAEMLDARKMLSYDATISQDSSKPQILIYHTHSQEGFVNSIPGDSSTTIVGVGERLAQILREEYGFNVIHHTGVYDGDSRDYAYANAGPALEQILAENPSIEVVIDLHRDGVADTTHLVTEVGGRTTAQFMFFNGLSYIKGKGPVDYLENPYIGENLAFSFQMKLAADEYYPGFARSTYLKSMRYNMHYCPKTLLIEVGAQTNTVEEVMNATDPLAHIIAMVLKGEKP